MGIQEGKGMFLSAIMDGNIEKVQLKDNGFTYKEIRFSTSKEGIKKAVLLTYGHNNELHLVEWLTDQAMPSDDFNKVLSEAKNPKLIIAE